MLRGAPRTGSGLPAADGAPVPSGALATAAPAAVGRPVPERPDASPAAADRPPEALLPGLIGLRLAVRGRPVELGLRLVLLAAGACVTYLLLAALAQAVGHPSGAAHRPLAAARLVWCAAPLAAVALLSAAVVAPRHRSAVVPALDLVGTGPLRSALPAAAEAAVTTTAASAAGWAFFAAHGPVPVDAHPLPVGALLSLLALPALVCAAVCGLALWPRRTGRTPAAAGPAAGLPAVAAGLAVGLYAHAPDRSAGALVRLPGGLAPLAPDAVLGWGLVLAGAALLGPGLTHLTGRLLASRRPGAVRLLAGRVLQADAGRVGRPLGVLSAVVCAAVPALWPPVPAHRGPGPLTLLAAGVLVLCPLAALVGGVLESRHARSGTAGLLRVLGAAGSLPRLAGLLRCGVLLLVLVPLTAALCWLALPV